MRIKTDKLRYTESTDGRFRDLRDIELTHNRKFARISINGIHRSPLSLIRTTRYANPGWAFGTELVFINWTHFRRHCWHLSFNAFRRGITFSYGRKIV